MARLVLHVVIVQVGNILAVEGIGLGHHAEVAAVFGEVVDVRRAHVGRHGGENVGERHAQLLGLLAVDGDLVAGRFGGEEGVSAGYFGALVGGGHKLVHRSLKGLDIAGLLALLQLETEAAGVAQARNSGRRHHHNIGPLDNQKLLLQPVDNALQLVGFVLALLPGLHLQEEGAAAGLEGEVQGVEAAHAGVVLDGRYFLADDFAHLVHNGFGAGAGRALRQLN